MAQSITNPQSSTYTQPNSAYTQPQPGAPRSGGGGFPMFLIMGILALIIIMGAIWYVFTNYSSISPSSSSSSNNPNFITVAQTHSSSGTPIYMSQSQAQSVFGTSLNRYTTMDLFNNNFIINASVFENLVPSLRNNITSGWITRSNSSSLSSYAALYYIVFSVPNAQHASTLVGAATISPWFMYGMNIKNTNSGSVYGLNYTYAEYTNSTSWAQTVYGWKGNYVVVALEYSAPGYLVNETALVNATARATP